MEDNSIIPAKRAKIILDYSHCSDLEDVSTHEDQTVSSKSETFDLLSPAVVPIPDQLILLELKYNERFSLFKFESPVANVYNPIDYAFQLHSHFIHKFCQSQKEILILGMNPGPWGMSQTGVPFGEISIVRDWLGITGEVARPKEENPCRPVLGLKCHRSEVSGKRLWGALKEAFGNDPYSCLKNIFIHNYCPLALMQESGKNITPAELKGYEKVQLCRVCDEFLIEVVQLLGVKTIVTVGRFVETQVKNLVKKAALDYLKIC